MWQFGFHAPELLTKEELDNYVLMQCTGLRDSEGALIWEGDIIEIILMDYEHQKPNLRGDGVVTPEITNICEVRFRPSAGFIALVRNAPYKGSVLRLKPGHDRVIGNKYENPELLNDASQATV